MNPRKQGSQLPQTRLTDADVRGIRYAVRVEQMPQNDVARLYGVSQAYISMVVRRMRRKGVK